MAEEETYAVVEVMFGPLPHGVTWDHPGLDAVSAKLAEVAFDATDLPEGADPGSSGMIRKIVRADQIGMDVDSSKLPVEMEFAHLGHYVSTYCLHGHHSECRGACKFADEHEFDDGTCRCYCHPKPDPNA